MTIVKLAQRRCSDDGVSCDDDDEDEVEDGDCHGPCV